MAEPGFYMSTPAILELLESPDLTDDQKAGLREELRRREEPTAQELIDELWGPDNDALLERDEWDAASKLLSVRMVLDQYDDKLATRKHTT